MLTILFYLNILLIINIILFIIGSTINKRSYKDREKNSPFECGFDPSISTRSPFSMRFFLLAVIFLIFDVEIILLIPLIMNIMKSNTHWPLTSSMIFLLILLMGLLHEWNQGSLNWMK
uniref:NADH-ubiquinone oxidoreductase chain 3 n=3 Tax=Sepiella TaxID=153279 RepID=A0A0U2R6T0_9MOLL|nr:NADH dehydrogenase subunit 3 [Sepiella japonica]YP_008757866.1 NADH dehydrogenase subunit 3 [Sepiella inermis]YP_009193047.1 NADH dehydrogenase subunit 3 [Sepiella maindroni]AGS18373.1 NADH dehydrogenase subunit 3 [Sepiella inermis]ALP86440.1 NADH dehydrogenase subunit 3 [Sepiella maindroni]BAM11168.1 NADH dehydrogenase subunit 3 [Sepiella japonica]